MKILLLVISSIFFIGCSFKPSIPPDQTNINGYTVPVMPDETVNNSTLDGVDSDGNGVRDDIDRYIAETYPDPVPHALAELDARSFLDVFKDPENANEKKLYISSIQYVVCQRYVEDFYGKKILKGFSFENFDPKMTNTRARARAYGIFNASMDGGISSSPPYLMSPADCPAEVNKALEKYKKIE